MQPGIVKSNPKCWDLPTASKLQINVSSSHWYTSISNSLKYHRFTSSGCKDIGIRKMKNCKDKTSCTSKKTFQSKLKVILDFKNLFVKHGVREGIDLSSFYIMSLIKNGWTFHVDIQIVKVRAD